MMIRSATPATVRSVLAVPTLNVSSLLVTIGALLVAVSAFLPWVVVFGGVETVRGIDVAIVIVAEGAAALALAVWGLGTLTGSPRGLWWLATIAGVVSLLYGALEIERLVSFISSPGATGALLRPQAGPGLPLFAIGSLLLLTGIVSTRPQKIPLPATVRGNGLLALGLFGAGWIHLALTSKHLDESTLLGLGFGLSALAQLALAGAVIRIPRNSVYLLVLALNVGLIVLYVYNVVVGLPLGSGEHEHGGGLVSFTIGHGEPIDLYGIACEVLQVLAIVLAFARLTPTTTSTAEAQPFVPQVG